jgi:predicted membrane protein
MQLALFGDIKAEVASSLSTAPATQTIISIFGDVRLTVPQGTRVAVSGFSLFGDTRITIDDDDAVAVKITFFSIFGDLTIVEKPANTSPARRPGIEHPFPY